MDGEALNVDAGKQSPGVKDGELALLVGSQRTYEDKSPGVWAWERWKHLCMGRTCRSQLTS